MSTKIETVSNVNNTPAKSRLTIKSAAELLGRVLIAGLFLLSGIGKITAYTATAGYMTSVGVPGVVLPLVIITEVFGSIAIMLGWRTRIVSFLLAGFTLLTGIFFHTNFSDQVQMIMFMKNVSITGAFLLLTVNGAGPLSLDNKPRK
ncbi:DoxX family protein [Luteibacter anthropi]|uniref:DoxX family protein n=1 Tax=Luteibacter anthropi TaxID=564369 RepID=UPI002032F780|nr:DoxX family protein [Luteibacter anthropi]URX62201.1 DoxX family protein [Luteibacter anthropi]